MKEWEKSQSRLLVCVGLRRLRVQVSALLVSSSLYANEALDLIEQQVGGKTYIPLELAKPKATANSETENIAEKKKILHVLPTPWLDQRPEPQLIVREPNAPAVDSASFSGLAEFGYQYGQLDQDRLDSARLRRARFTTMLGMFYRTTLEASGLLDSDGYAGIGRLSIRQYLNQSTALTAGKFRPPFGHFYSTDPSIREIPDLPVLTRQLSPGNTLGVYVDGYRSNWEWGIGWFSGQTARDVPGIDGSGFGTGHLGYTFFKDDTDQEFSRWYFDFLWNFEGDRSEAIAGGSRQLVATGLQFHKDDTYDLVGEFNLAHGGSLGSVWGLIVQGSSWLSQDFVKLVARYHYAGAGDSSVSDPRPGVRRDLGAITAGFGIADPGSDALGAGLGSSVVGADEFHSFYAGLNFHLIDPYLILQTGGEFSVIKTRTGESYDAWTLMSGMRVAF